LRRSPPLSAGLPGLAASGIAIVARFFEKYGAV
jgi:hypothetical protein